MRFAALLCVLLALCGCVRALTDAQAGELSQAQADAAAAAMTTDAEARAALAEAVANRLAAACAGLDLPAPATPAAVLVNRDGTPNPAAVSAELTAAKAAAKEPPAGMWGMIAGGVGGAALLALGVLRTSPGIFGMLADMAHTFLAPKATREMREAQAKAAVVAESAMAYGHAVTEAAERAGLGPQVEQIKAQAAEVQDRLGIRPQVAAILASHKARRRPVASPAPPRVEDDRA